MRYRKGFPHHECAPQEYRGIPDYTGEHELDAVIHHNKNKDIPHRLSFYLERETAYGARTGYDGYHNYGGDT
jgi:hypothetical protein